MSFDRSNIQDRDIFPTTIFNPETGLTATLAPRNTIIESISSGGARNVLIPIIIVGAIILFFIGRK